MQITINLTDNNFYTQLLPDEKEFQNILRTLSGARDRGMSFVEIDKKTWVNVQHILSIDVDRSEKFNVELAPDTSNLNAVPKQLTPEELRAVQLIKQPLIPVMEAAQKREDEMREAQNLPGKRRAK